MKHTICERESEVVAAIKSNRHDAALDQHIHGCTSCTETRRITQLLNRYAASVESTIQPPATARIWRKVQAQQQEAILKRATRGIALMRVLGSAYVFLLAAWGLRAFWRMQSAELTPALATLRTGTVLSGATVALLCIAAGAFFLLFAGRRLSTIVAST